jgi:hypothetical protein
LAEFGEYFSENFELHKRNEFIDKPRKCSEEEALAWGFWIKHIGMA